MSIAFSVLVVNKAAATNTSRPGLLLWDGDAPQNHNCLCILLHGNGRVQSFAVASEGTVLYWYVVTAGRSH